MALPAPDSPPIEDQYLYQALPDVPLKLSDGSEARLSQLSSGKPLLVTFVFTRCAGICSPLLRSLKGAAAKAEGGFRILAISFDPRDTPADLSALAAHVGVAQKQGWNFAIAAPADMQRIAKVTGFWFQWDSTSRQYDHPGLVLVVDRGRILRMRAGGTVPAAFLQEALEETRGKLAKSYPLPGKVAFRCFQYDPATGELAFDWGAVLMLLPGGVAIVLAVVVFRRGRTRVRISMKNSLMWP